MACPGAVLKQGPMDIYPARIPKAPDFGIRQCGPGRDLSLIISLLPIRSGNYRRNAALYPGGTFL